MNRHLLRPLVNNFRKTCFPFVRYFQQKFRPKGIRSEKQKTRVFSDVLFLIDDRVFFHPEPLPKILNETVEVLIKANVSQLSFPQHLVNKNWDLIQAVGNDDRPFNHKVIQLYQPFFQFDQDLFNKIFRNQKIDFKKILVSYYRLNCEPSNKELIQKIKETGFGNVRILKDKLWDQIGFNCRSFFNSKLDTTTEIIPMQAVKMMTEQTEKELSFSKVKLKFTKAIVITSDLKILRNIENWKHGNNSVKALYFDSKRHKRDEALQKMASNFRFFEQLQHKEEVDSIYRLFWDGIGSFRTTIDDIDDVMHILKQGSSVEQHTD